MNNHLRACGKEWPFLSPGKPALRSEASCRGGRHAASDAAFDVWLNHGLTGMFAHVAEEPIPPELITLIETCRRAS